MKDVYSTNLDEAASASIEILEMFEHRPLKNYSSLAITAAAHMTNNEMPPLELIQEIAKGDEEKMLSIIGNVTRYLNENVEGRFRALQNDTLKKIS